MGLFPLHSREILDRIPKHRNREEVNTSVSEVVIDHLKRLRYGEPDKEEHNKPKLKKRINCEIGKSLSANDLVHEPICQDEPDES